MLIFETVRVLAIPTSILVVFQISICSRMILRLSRTYRANCCWLIYSSSSCILDRSHLQSVLDSRAVLLPQGLHLLEQVMSQMHLNGTLRDLCRTGTALHSALSAMSSRHSSTSVCRTSVISWVPDFARRVAPLVVS